MLPVGQNRPTAETAVYETRLSSFKVNELQTLLSSFRVQKIGKKNELYARCVDLLRTPNLTKNVIEKIREIETRVNPQRSSPYPLPNLNHNQNPYAQPAHTMYGRPNGGMYGGGYGGMPNMHQYGGGIGLHQNMGGGGGGMMSITPRPARNLTPMPLPFYDPIHTLVEPQELPPNNNSSSKMNARMEVMFTLSAEHHMKLSVREDQFPRTEVQLRFFNATGDILHIEQPDDFPLNCAVKINDATVSLPNVIPTNKPNQEPKRPSRPVNITQYVISASREKRHSLKIEWLADKRQWAVAIYVVTRVNSDILRNRILKSPSYELPYETTEATIRKRLGGDDDDVAMDSLKISLLCPLMKTRMKTAARCRDCTHLQCFDLDSYLMLNEKKPAWKCGVCNNNAPYHKLIIDKYFMKMLNELGPMVTDVELLKDGNYRVIKEDDVMDLSDDDDCDVKPSTGGGGASTSGGGAGGSKTSSVVGIATTGGIGGGRGSGSGTPSGAVAAATGGGGTSKSNGDDIITISDDEDYQDEELRKAIRASMPSSATDQSPRQRTPPPRNHMQASPPSDDSIIILDDTPPRPEPVSSRVTGASSSVGSASTWRNLTSSAGGSGPASASSSSPAGAVAGGPSPSSSSGGGAGGASGSGGGYGSGQQQQRTGAASATTLTLADALGQAGHHSRPPGVVPSQLTLNGLNAHTTPLSAAAVAQQHTIYNWNGHQQTPQSAPPTVNSNPWAQQYGMQGGAGGGQFNAYYNQMQYLGQQLGAYGGGGGGGGGGVQQQQWAPPNGPPVYQQHNGGGVIRQNDHLNRDPRDPR